MCENIITLTDDQQIVFDSIVSDIDDIIDNGMTARRLISLKSPAGCGKTTVAAFLVREFIHNKNYTIAVLTPTHQALGVIKSNIDFTHEKLDFMTIHSHLRLIPSIDNITGKKSFRQNKNKNKQEEEKKYDMLIIDESSMISNELFEFIVSEINNERIKCVLFVGDECQLYPID